MSLNNAKRGALALALALIAASSLHAESIAQLRGRVAAASASIKDLKGTITVHPASRSDAKEISKGIISFLDQGFREANVSYIRPDKFRAQGKAKGIDVTYVLNGNRNQVTAPSLMLKKTDDLSDKVVRKQNTLDLGFLSDSLWRDYTITVAGSSKGTTNIRLVPHGMNDKRYDLVTVDSKTLKVLRRERHDGKGVLKSRSVYGSHVNVGKMPVATLVKVYSPDGGYAGSLEMTGLHANTGIPASLFTIK